VPLLTLIRAHLLIHLTRPCSRPRRENAAWLRDLFRSGRPDADDFAALASALGFRPSGGR
jgi:hypothetical protein